MDLEFKTLPIFKHVEAERALDEISVKDLCKGGGLKNIHMIYLINFIYVIYVNYIIYMNYRL